MSKNCTLFITTSTHSEVNIKDRENLSAIVLTDIVIWVVIVMVTVILTKNDDNVSPNKQVHLCLYRNNLRLGHLCASWMFFFLYN